MPPKKAKAKAKAEAVESGPASAVAQIASADSQSGKMMATIVEAQQHVKNIVDHDAFTGVEADLPAAVGSHEFAMQVHLRPNLCQYLVVKPMSLLLF